MALTDNYKLHRGGQNTDPLDVIAWLKEHKPNSTYIFLPDLVYDIHRQSRRKIEFIVSELVRFYRENKEYVSADRTSEIFITERTRGGRMEKRRIRFYPMMNHSYYSHFMLRMPPKEWI